MAKVIVNIPVLIEADLGLIDSETEAAFHFEKTDVVRLSNAKLPASIIVPASAMVVIEE